MPRKVYIYIYIYNHLQQLPHQEFSKIIKIHKNRVASWSMYGYLFHSSMVPRFSKLFLKCLDTFQLVLIFLSFCIRDHVTNRLSTFPLIFHQNIEKFSRIIKHHQNHQKSSNIGLRVGRFSASSFSSTCLPRVSKLFLNCLNTF